MGTRKRRRDYVLTHISTGSGKTFSEMNNKHYLRRVCREHTGVVPYVNVQHTGGSPLSSSFRYYEFSRFVEKDKARNASSVLGFLPQDAAKIEIKN